MSIQGIKCGKEKGNNWIKKEGFNCADLSTIHTHAIL